MREHKEQSKTMYTIVDDFDWCLNAFDYQEKIIKSVFVDWKRKEESAAIKLRCLYSSY